MPTLFCDFGEIWEKASNPSSDLATCIMPNIHMINHKLDLTLTEGDVRYFIQILDSVRARRGYAKSNNPSTTQAVCILALQKIDLCSNKLLAGYCVNTIDDRNRDEVMEEMKANRLLINDLKLLIVAALDPYLDPSYICFFEKKPDQKISVSFNDGYFDNLFTKLGLPQVSVILDFLPLVIDQVDNIAEKYKVDKATASHALLSAIDIAITETTRQVNLRASTETGVTSPDSVAYDAEEIKYDFLSNLLSGLESSKNTLSRTESPPHKRQRLT